MTFDKDTCIACGGTTEIECEDCDGMGYYDVAETDECSECLGYGEVSCPDCV